MNLPAQRLDILVTVSEIAHLTGGKPSSVSTWRARSADFPQPRIPGPPPLFDARQVFAWVNERPNAHLRGRSEPGPEWWWRKAVGAYIGERGLDAARPALVALVLLADRARAAGAELLEWPRLLGADDPGAEMGRLAARIESAESSMADLLVEPLEPLSADPYLADLLGYLDRAAAVVTSHELLDIVLRSDAGAAAARVAGTLTKTSLARLMVALARVAEGDVVIDPAAGEGEVLVQCARAFDGRVTVKGQEIDVVPWRIARSRLAMMGADADLGDRPTNSMVDDRFAGVRADVVLIDPPFDSPSSGETSEAIVPPPLDAWVRYGLRHLGDSGRLVVLVPGRFLRPRQRVRRGFAEFTMSMKQMMAFGQVESLVVLPGRMRADVPDDQALLVLRAERAAGAGIDNRVARRVTIAKSSAGSEGYIEQLLALIERVGDRWVDEASDLGVVHVTQARSIDDLLSDDDQHTPADVVAVPRRRLSRTVAGVVSGAGVEAGAGVVAEPPADDEVTRLRNELRVMQGRLDDVRGRARDLADTLHDELLQMHLNDPARYRRIEDQVDALLRRL